MSDLLQVFIVNFWLEVNKSSSEMLILVFDFHRNVKKTGFSLIQIANFILTIFYDFQLASCSFLHLRETVFMSSLLKEETQSIFTNFSSVFYTFDGKRQTKQLGLDLLFTDKSFYFGRLFENNGLFKDLCTFFIDRNFQIRFLVYEALSQVIVRAWTVQNKKGTFDFTQKLIKTCDFSAFFFRLSKTHQAPPSHEHN